MGKRKARRKGGPKPRPRGYTVPGGGLSTAVPRQEPAPDTVLPATAQPAAQLNRPPQRVGGDQMLVRSVEMSLGGSVNRQVRKGNRMVIEGGDPAIPLHNVPYFTSDLVRLAAIGGAMVVLLIVSSLLILPRLH